MDRCIGFIGMGNMAMAIAQGFLRAGQVQPAQLYAYAPHPEKLQARAREIGFTPCGSLSELMSAADLHIMCCKPGQIAGILGEIAPRLPGKTLLSVAAGWSYEVYKPYLPPDTRFQFIMPNTPAMTGDGVLLFEDRHTLMEEERLQIMELFRCLGMVRELPSALMGIGGTISGRGPAFIDLLLEAFADAAVKYGLPRALAYELTSQTVLGSARLQLSTGKHPAQLKDEVCSPGGTTILGIDALEKAGLRAACLKAVDAVMQGRR